MKEDKGVYLRPLGPDEYPELKGGARTLFRRLLALTKSGTQECTYTNEQAEKEVSMAPRSVNRHIKSLKDMGLLNVEKTSNAFGINVRIITVNRDKLTKLPAAASKASEVISGSTKGSMHQEQEAPNGPAKDAAKVQANLPNQDDGVAAKVQASWPQGSGQSSGQSSGQLASTQEAVTLNYMGRIRVFPYLILEDDIKNIEIIHARALERAPLLFSSLTHFDLRHLAKYLPGEFTPFGQDHSLEFDFTDLYEMYAYDKIDDLRNQPAEFWRCVRPETEGYWRDFFVMSTLIELTCFEDQNFTRVDKCDPYGKGFEEYYFKHRYGFQHLLLNAVFASDDPDQYDGYSLFKTISSSFVAGGKRHIIKFARGVIAKELMAIINDPKACDTAYKAWLHAFIRQMNLSWQNQFAKCTPSNSPRYCHRYFDPELGRFLLCDERGFMPRLMMPTLLFRRLVTIHGAALISECGCTEETTPRAIKFITTLHLKQENYELFEHLARSLGDTFPFLRRGGVIDHV